MERIFVRFSTAQQKLNCLQNISLTDDRAFAPRLLRSQPNLMHIAATDQQRMALEASGAEIFEDVSFSVMCDDEDREAEAARWARMANHKDLADDYTMQDVMEQIGAPEAWVHTRGKGATIAIVDTGIAGALPCFSKQRRSPFDAATAHCGEHWLDGLGHGSMCAVIAASSKEDGGKFDGVAPEAAVLSIRSTLKSTDLFDVYEELIRARQEGIVKGPLIVSNSYGVKTCVAPDVLPANHPFMDVLLAAIDAGIFITFAAGNNHYDLNCRHDPTAAGPNSIWGPNSHDRIISVGTVNRDLTNCDPATPHANSSRGPGQWAVKTIKPDCVAPTYGQVQWGTSLLRKRWWGTSGACPQVAGLAALILSERPDLTPAQVGQIILDTCYLLPGARTCVGKGVINCAAAVEKTRQLPVTS